MTIERTSLPALVNYNIRDYYYTYPSGEIGIRYQLLFDKLYQEHNIPILNLSSSLDYYAFTLLEDLFVEVNKVKHETQSKERLSIFLTYFPYSREDKLVQIVYPNYKTQILGTLSQFCNKLDKFGLKNIYTLDLHSEVPTQYFKNTKFHSLKLEQWIIESIIRKCLSTKNSKHLLLVFPDKGAKDRYQYVSDIINTYGYNTDIYETFNISYFSKVREQSTGKITSINLEGQVIKDVTDILVFDDICDGGTTFLECGKILKKNYPSANMHLYTTHGMYTNDAKYQELCNMYKNIICTDSFSGMRTNRNLNHHVIAL